MAVDGCEAQSKQNAWTGTQMRNVCEKAGLALAAMPISHAQAIKN